MRRSLPFDAETAKRQARDLLHGLQRRDSFALTRYRCIDPRLGAFKSRLADARYIIAREYGYDSWQKLMENLGRRGGSCTAASGM